MNIHTKQKSKNRIRKMLRGEKIKFTPTHEIKTFKIKAIKEILFLLLLLDFFFGAPFDFLVVRGQ